MASIPLLSPPTTTTAAAVSHHTLQPTTISLFLNKPNSPHRRLPRLHVSSPTNTPPSSTASKPEGETVFFDGGTHYGNLVVNILLGFTLLWLPLTLAAVSQALYLRYRFTNLRVTVISGFTGQERSDFSYSVIKEVQFVPRFIGEWGDIIITLKDGTKVDLRSVPRFRQVANYVRSMTNASLAFTKSASKTKKGF
ncbi:hypothetical protein RJT34_06752 [Clitoria ternatea]|uniref:YdbS-like PH domain-containing protein n=1 Tax=Clitoria ternatea TaxID=43366 RepID=A0AAN9K4G1_CLITE